MSTADQLVASPFPPSDEQDAIQRSRSKTILVEANAGATKTTTLAFRIRWAIELNVPPEAIQVLTFTEPACEAMRIALNTVGVPPALVRRVKIQTFDAFATTVLRSLEPKAAPVKHTPEDVSPVVVQAMQRLGMSADSGFIERFLNTAGWLKGTLALSEAAWNGEEINEEWAESVGIEFSHVQLFRAYENLRYPIADGIDMPEFRWTFDATYDLARQLADPEPMTYLHEIPAWPRSIRLLMVDEMHDTNRAMYVILKTLLDTNPCYFCGVGDVDQVIHSQSGADHQYMGPSVSFGKREVTRYPLTKTRRFGKSLAAASGQLARKPYASDASHPTKVDIQTYDDHSGSSCESALISVLREWKGTPQAQLADLAILLRHSWQSIDIENALVQAGFEYQTKGFVSYLRQPEVLLIRALLAMATGNYEQLNSAATRADVVRSVVFFCGVQLDHDESEAESQEERLASAIRAIDQSKESLAAFMEYQVLQKAAPALAGRMRTAITMAQTQGTQEGWFDGFLDALDIQSWIKRVFIERQRRMDALKYFEGLKRAARMFKTAAQFFDSMGALETKNAPTTSSQKNAMRAASAKRNTLTLSLIPAVKGLEFEHVVMPYLDRGIFPFSASHQDRDERNLFYVGITRARSALTVIASERSPSEFVQRLRPGAPS